MKRKEVEQAVREREQVVLDIVRESIAERGYPPTLKELAKRGVCCSPGHAKAVVDRMVRRGLLQREKGVARSIVLVGENGVARTESAERVTNAAVDRLFEIEAVCMRAGFDGEPEDLSDWLELRLAMVADLKESA